MVTEDSRAQAIEIKDDLVFRYPDKSVVKGRSQPVLMYELIGFDKDITPKIKDCISFFDQGIKDCISFFDQGIKKYLARDWQGAIAEFERSSELERFGPVNPSKIYLDRCKEMIANPPGEAWDGVYVMITK